MEAPTIRSTIVDPEGKITYHVMAYRTLTRDELVQAVNLYLSSRKGKKPKKGSAVTIVSSIGMR